MFRLELHGNSDSAGRLTFEVARISTNRNRQIIWVYSLKPPTSHRFSIIAHLPAFRNVLCWHLACSSNNKFGDLVVRSVLTRTFWLHSYVLSFVTQQKKGTAKSCGAVTECWSARWAELPNVLDLKFIKILSYPLFEGRCGPLNRFPMRKCAFVGETRGGE